jgi:hypothetical protein
MNLKKAKAIRGLVLQLVAKDIIKGPWAQYRKVDRNYQVPTGKTGDDGLPLSETITASTIILDPMSPKGVYRRMKKMGPAAVLAGKA